MADRLGVRVAACIVALLVARTAAAQRLSIDDVTKAYAPGVLDKHFREALKPPTLELLAANHNALWLLMYDGAIGARHEHYCWSVIGVTEEAPKGRNSRVPTLVAIGMERVSDVDAIAREARMDCRNAALHRATHAFAEASVDELRAAAQDTREGGGRRAQKPAAPDKSSLFQSGLSDAGRQAVFDVIPGEFTRAFDYRRLQWVVLAYAFELQGDSVCFAIAGVSARTPDDRNARSPGDYRTNALIEVGKSGEAGRQACKDELAPVVVKDALALSWDAKGLLHDYSFAQEVGVPPVASYQRKDPRAEKAQQQAQFRKGLKIGSTTHCGLVTEVRGPIVRVQTMVGEIWFKAAQLFPEGEHACRFVNHVYQDSET